MFARGAILPAGSGFSNPPRVGIYPVDSPDVSFPLTSAVCHYQVVDVQTVASLVQTFVSNATAAKDVFYVFPLPQDAAVSSFKAVIDGQRTIKGVVKERRQAKRDYDQAVAKGKTAALLQKQHADIFQVSLGNLKPNQTIAIHISWVSVIAHDGAQLDSLRLMLPVTIAPRYGFPPPSLDPKRSIAIPVRPNLQVTVSVQMSGNITSITSPTHSIAVTRGAVLPNATEVSDPRKAHISLEGEAFLDKDIVIVLASQKLDHPRCTVETDVEGGTDAYALTLVPQFNLPSLESQEYIFLVDRSGSMEGPRIKAVRAALQIMLRSLPTQNTTFNIWSFGDTFSSLWPSSRIYSKNSVEEATAHIDQIDANYGGTQIAKALQGILKSEKPQIENTENIPRAVFVLTDGEAWDLDGVIDQVRKAAEKAKVEKSLLRTFVLGVGDGVSTPMCEGIARAGKGIAIFVGNNEKPEGKLMQLLKAARGGVIEDLSIDWGVGDATAEPEVEIIQTGDAAIVEPKVPATKINLFQETPITEHPSLLGPGDVAVKLDVPPQIQQAPSTDKLPIPLYPGFRSSIFAIVKRTKNEPVASTVKLTGQVLGHPVVLEVPVTRATRSPLREIDDNLLPLHVLAARALIQSIEDLPNSEVNEAKIVRLGTQYSLASSQTSFIAIDEDKKVIELREVPQPGEEESLEESAPRGPDNLLGFFVDQVADVMMARKAAPGQKVFYSHQASLMDELDDDGPPWFARESVVPENLTPSPIEGIARNQSFEGYFFPTTLEGVLPTLPGLPGTLKTLVEVEAKEKEKVWVTVLVVAYLSKVLNNERNTWGFMVEKALDWVRGTLNGVVGAEELLGEWLREADKAF